MEDLSRCSKLSSPKETTLSTTQNRRSNLMDRAKQSFYRMNYHTTISASNRRISLSSMTWKSNSFMWTRYPRKRRRPSISGSTPHSSISRASCLLISPWLKKRPKIKNARNLTRISELKSMHPRFTSIKCKRLKLTGPKSWYLLKNSLKMKSVCLK